MCHLAQTVAHSETSLGILPSALAAAEGRGGRGRGGEALKPEQCIFHVEVGSQVPPVGRGLPQEFRLLLLLPRRHDQRVDGGGWGWQRRKQTDCGRPVATACGDDGRQQWQQQRQFATIEKMYS